MRADARRGLVRTFLFPLAVLAGGLALTWVAAHGNAKVLESEARARFNRQADGLEAEFLRRMGRAEYGMRSLRAAWLMAGRLDDKDLHTYVGARDMGREFPGVRGFGVVERVQRRDLPRFVRRQQAGGQPDFAVRSDGDHPELLVIRSIAPIADNRAALGYDAASDPTRRDAAQAAIDSGMSWMTEPVTLLQDERRGKGWLLFVPVYRGKPTTVEQRRSALVALLYSPMVTDELLAPVAESAGGQLAFRLYDGTPPDGRLIYDGLPLRLAGSERSSVRPVVIGNRVLTLDIRETAEGDWAGGPWIIASGGALLSIGLAVLAWLLAAGKMRALAAAAAMGADMKRMASIVERTQSAVFSTDLQGRLTWVNAGFVGLVGRPQEALLGQAAVDVLGTRQDAQACATSDPAADPGDSRSRRMELAGKRPDGTPYWTELTLQREVDAGGSPLGWMGIAVDVTRRKEAELRLKGSEHMMRTIADNVPASISYWDEHGRCLFVNQRFREIFGLQGKPHEAIGVRDLPVDTLEAIERRFEGVMDGMPQQFEHVVHSPDGRESTWMVHLIPDMPGDRVQGFFSLANEVTQLRRARDQALEGSRAKTRFLSSMSHEIRTPMNAILGMLTLLRSTPLTDRQEDYAVKAEGAARSLLSLLNDVLDYSKIEAGKMQLDCRPFSLEKLLSELSVILSANLGAKEVEVLYDLDPAVPDQLVGDDMRLRQILINLGGNALKFTSQGEVILRTRLVERREGQATVEFQVVDSGIGISVEEQQRLFGDYVQATSQTARQFGGTGLGLGICRRLTELMDSKLQLQSAVGQGSTFHFSVTFPVAGEPTAGPADPQCDIGRVLIVDDNELARVSLAALARSQGWRPDVAASGEAGIALLTRATADGDPYQAVFVDWRMPGLDGWEASMRIRSLPSGGRTPVVVMVTAHGREMLGQRPVREQALLDGFLVKPVTAVMLRDAVARALHGTAGAGAPVVREAPQPLAGLRLLVVEDNPVNQQIARELLAAQGARVEVAEDGQKAVDRLAADSAYDAVLMDVLMPVMDGLTATSRIRQDLGLQLPIVAMTANAMDSDRLDCLAAGMNDHVGKPVVLAEVIATLLRHVQRRAAAAPAASTSASAAPAASEAARSAAFSAEAVPPLLDRRGAIERLGGDSALFERLLPVFRGNLQKSTQELASARERAAHEELRRVIHSIKGMAGTMGAASLAVAAQHAEAQLRSGQGYHDQCAQQVASAIEDTLRALG
ncbi:MAG TPA: CHASE domain-containing protein [Ramlibacter sp.]|jgi:PAS domain S-box-containing protein|uniref:CHASE domain-containing protein n=1 Tax=Ramlibacter sp. TaxID=1917967 RepID=UPI002D626E67|nr:CHASE domain-containing protein [Ramlibacter sp.]HZY20249.1 CHASE domain-containing protein [Ramlibacter sp.]